MAAYDEHTARALLRRIVIPNDEKIDLEGAEIAAQEFSRLCIPVQMRFAARRRRFVESILEEAGGDHAAAGNRCGLDGVEVRKILSRTPALPPLNGWVELRWEHLTADPVASPVKACAELGALTTYAGSYVAFLRRRLAREVFDGRGGRDYARTGHLLRVAPARLRVMLEQEERERKYA